MSVPTRNRLGIYRRVVLVGDMGSDEWFAATNSIRHGLGLPLLGHGMTYDFFVGLEGFRRARRLRRS